ncbi:hypothetical protein Tco_1420060 [Tanacetum coccineum]
MMMRNFLFMMMHHLDGDVTASIKGDGPAKPPQIITTNTLSNIKLPVLQKDDYDTWAMEMEHYLEYIDNEVWKVILNEYQRSSVAKGKDGVLLDPLPVNGCSKDLSERFHGMDDAKEDSGAAIKTRLVRKVECSQSAHNGHFAWDCMLEVQMKVKGRKQINWVEQTTDEELNHALMAFTVNNEASMCSKLCLDSYNALQAKYDECQSEVCDQEVALVAITEKYRRIGMKAVKDKDALQKKFDSWSASSKNLWKLIDCGMSSTVKIGLGYGIKSNAEVLGYEEEISRVMSANDNFSLNDDEELSLHDDASLDGYKEFVTLEKSKITKIETLYVYQSVCGIYTLIL